MCSQLSDSHQMFSEKGTEQGCPLSLPLCAFPTEPLAFTTEPAQRFGQSQLIIKNIKSAALFFFFFSFFSDNILLYLCKTLVSIQHLKEVLQSCSTLYAFSLNMTRLQAMPQGTHPVIQSNLLYPVIPGGIYVAWCAVLTH